MTECKTCKKGFNCTLGGAIAGLAVALGGAIKDSPYEGFKPKTFLRSPVIGAVMGGLLCEKFTIKEFGLIFLATIGIERIIVEGYKVVRAQKPGKFEFGEWGKMLPNVRSLV